MKKRQFYKLLVVVAAMAFVTGAMSSRFLAPETASADSVSDVITTGGLAVVDDAGGARMLVTTSDEDGSPMVAFYEGEGVARAVYSLSGNGEPTIVMNNEAGDLRLVIGVTDEGGPGALMKDKDGKSIWSAP